MPPTRDANRSSLKAGGAAALRPPPNGAAPTPSGGSCASGSSAGNVVRTNIRSSTGDARRTTANAVLGCPPTPASASGSRKDPFALKEDTFTQLKSMPAWAPPIVRLLEAFGHLVGENGNSNSVNDIRKWLSKRDLCRRALDVKNRIDAGDFPKANLAPVRTLKDQASSEMSVERISKISSAAGAIAAWLYAVVDRYDNLAANATSTSSSASRPGSKGKVRGHYFAGPSVHHLSTTLHEKMSENGLPADATVKDIEPVIIRPASVDVVCPRDGEKGASYVDSIGEDPEHVGIATYMLSYSWGYLVRDVTDTLTHFCSVRKLNPRRTYIWCCVACINQHRVQKSQKAGESVPFADLQKKFKDRVEGIGHIIAMMVPWFDPGYIKRVWCDFELYTASNGNIEVSIAMPPQETNNFMDALETGKGIDQMWKTLGEVDVETAMASVPDDRKQILTLIQQGPGYAAFNNIIAKHLQSWVITETLTYFDERVALKDRTITRLSKLGSVTAQLLSKSGRPADSKNVLTKLKDLLEASDELDETEKKKWLAPIMGSLAVARKSLGEFEAAKELLSDAMALDADATLSWRDINTQVSLIIESREYEQGFATLKKALQSLPEDAEERRLAKVGLITNLAICQQGMGKFEDALASCKEVQEALKELGNNASPDHATVLQNIGGIRMKMKDPAGAKAAFEEACKIYRKFGVLQGKDGGQAILNSAICCVNCQEASEAERFASEALIIFQTIDCAELAKKAQSILDMVSSAPAARAPTRDTCAGWREHGASASTKMSKQDWAGAAADFRKAVESFDAAGEKDLSIKVALSMNCAITFRRSGDIDAALSMLGLIKETLASANNLNSDAGLSMLLETACVYKSKQDNTSSKKTFAEAIAVAVALKRDQNGAGAEIYFNHAICCLKDSDFDEAEVSAEQAKSLSSEAGLADLAENAKSLLDTLKQMRTASMLL